MLLQYPQSFGQPSLLHSKIILSFSFSCIKRLDYSVFILLFRLFLSFIYRMGAFNGKQKKAPTKYRCFLAVGCFRSADGHSSGYTLVLQIQLKYFRMPGKYFRKTFTVKITGRQKESNLLSAYSSCCMLMLLLSAL